MNPEPKTTTTDRKKCVVLTRVSDSKAGGETESHDTQEKIGRSVAASRDLTVLKVFSWSVSGRKRERPDIEEVVEFIKKSPERVHEVIVRGIDRFTRAGSLEYQLLKKELAQNGVGLVDSYGIIQPTINTLERLGFEYEWSRYSPSEISEIVIAESNRSEVTRILTQMVGASIQVVQSGYQVGPPDDGYVNKTIYVDGKKKVIQVEDPERARFYREMFELRSAGVYTDEEIVEKVNAMGFRTKIRNRWDKTHGKVVGQRGGCPLTVKQLQTLIQRPVYCGVVCGKWTRGRPIRAQYTGLVSIEIFNKANRGKVYIKQEKKSNRLEILYDYSPIKVVQRRMRSNPLFPFKNVIVCPRCGKPFLGSCPQGKSGRGFPTYHCARGHRYFGVSKKEFEGIVRGFVGRIRFTEAYAGSLERVLLDKYREREKEVARRSSDVSRNIAELKKEKAAALDALIATKNPSIREEIEARIEGIERRMEEAKRQRGQLEVSEDDIRSFLRHAKYLIEHLEEVLIHKRNLPAQQALFGLIFEALPTYQELVNGTPKLSLIFQLSLDSDRAKSHVMDHVGLGWNTVERTILKWKAVREMIDLPTSYPKAA